jgi:hypothetical protein
MSQRKKCPEFSFLGSSFWLTFWCHTCNMCDRMWAQRSCVKKISSPHIHIAHHEELNHTHSPKKIKSETEIRTFCKCKAAWITPILFSGHNLQCIKFEVCNWNTQMSMGMWCRWYTYNWGARPPGCCVEEARWLLADPTTFNNKCKVTQIPICIICWLPGSKAVLGGYPVWQIRNPRFQLVKTKLELGMVFLNWFWNWNLNLLRTGPRTKEKKFEDREFLPHGSDN